MNRNDFDIEMNRIEAPVISFENVSMKYKKGAEALKDVSFTIGKGEFVFVVGDSGSGKTTLLKLMLKETVPTKGRVYVEGREVSKLPRRKLAGFRRNIGVVFQDFRLLKDRDAYENIAFAQRIIGTDPEMIRRRIPKVLSLVGLSDKYKAYPDEMSGGQQQRTAIARALVNNPVILLADEPTGNLDPKNSAEIMELLENINRRGTTVIVVTHNRDLVDKMKKRVLTLHDGRLVRDEKKGFYDEKPVRENMEFDYDHDMPGEK